jgi:glucose/arabinose dehydrogenase
MNALRSLSSLSGPMLLSLVFPVILASAAPVTAADGSGGEPALAVTIELVADNLPKPVALAIDPDNRIFFTDKSGSVRLIENDQLLPDPVITLSTDDCFERGMLGITLDPDWANNHYVYVYHTLDAGPPCADTENRVVRFIEWQGTGYQPTVLYTFPAVGAGNHNGGNLHFGKDGKLYVTVGDDARSANSQDLGSPNGKMHRLNPDGTIPADNPFVGQAGVEESIFAYGLRNSFDFDFDPVTGDLFASENGPNCDDEVNRVLPGYNYGWRSGYPCGDDNPAFNDIPALWRWTPPISPTGITFYRGSNPRLQNRCFMCDYNDGNLHYLALSPDRTQILDDVIINLPGGIHCHEDIETGPDGNAYFIEDGGYVTGRIWRVVVP